LRISPGPQKCRNSDERTVVKVAITASASNTGQCTAISTARNGILRSLEQCNGEPCQTESNHAAKKAQQSAFNKQLTHSRKLPCARAERTATSCAAKAREIKRFANISRRQSAATRLRARTSPINTSCTLRSGSHGVGNAEAMSCRLSDQSQNVRAMAVRSDCYCGGSHPL